MSTTANGGWVAWTRVIFDGKKTNGWVQWATGRRAKLLVENVRAYCDKHARFGDETKDYISGIVMRAGVPPIPAKGERCTIQPGEFPQPPDAWWEW